MKAEGLVSNKITWPKGLPYTFARYATNTRGYHRLRIRPGLGNMVVVTLTDTDVTI